MAHAFYQYRYYWQVQSSLLFFLLLLICKILTVFALDFDYENPRHKAALKLYSSKL